MEDKKVTYKEACELIAKYLKETKGIDMGAKHVFNLSPTGDLWHVHALYNIATAYYKRKKAEADEESAKAWDEAIWGIPYA